MLKRKDVKHDYAPRKLSNNTIIGDLKGTTIGDFWSWAYSDVLMNTVRSVFAEYLVGLALDETSKPRIEWDSVDFRYRGKKIEVKSSAYLQSWPQNGYSDVRFDIGIRKHSWDPETGETLTNATRMADCYVLCLYSDKEEETANVLHVGRWKFYVLKTGTINRELGDRRSIGLKSLEKITSPVDFGQLNETIRKVLFDEGHAKT